MPNPSYQPFFLAKEFSLDSLPLPRQFPFFEAPLLHPSTPSPHCARPSSVCGVRCAVCVACARAECGAKCREVSRASVEAEGLCEARAVWRECWTSWKVLCDAVRASERWAFEGFVWRCVCERVASVREICATPLCEPSAGQGERGCEGVVCAGCSRGCTGIRLSGWVNWVAVRARMCRVVQSTNRRFEWWWSSSLVAGGYPFLFFLKLLDIIWFSNSNVLD